MTNILGHGPMSSDPRLNKPISLETSAKLQSGACAPTCGGVVDDQDKSEGQYIPRNMHMVLLCFALLWLCNRS